jgi:adenylate cyclase
MKRGTQIKLRQLTIIMIGWVAMGLLKSVYDQLEVLTQSPLGSPEEFSFMISAARNMGAGFIGALIGGSLLVFFVNVKYQDKPYGYTVAFVLFSFILIVFFISLLMGLILVPMRLQRPLSDPVCQAAFWDFLKDGSHIKAAIFWSFVVAITQMLLQANSKFGHGNFWNMVRGRYNTPKEEQKIFMFLDLNASTTIAERLGDEKYHAFLKDFFADITLPILENRGSIYQYVGDEVVVAWDYADGQENTDCLKCFYDMKVYIQSNRDKYLRRYGIVPTFKAGLHCGKVIAGEVGIMKRDITYSGDVLNTTSRIVSKCGEFNEELIASSDLLSEIRSLKNFITRPLGAIQLKGKEKTYNLSALVPVI